MNPEKDYQSSGRILEGSELERVMKLFHIDNKIKEEVAKTREYNLPNEEERKYLGINT